MSGKDPSIQDREGFRWGFLLSAGFGVISGYKPQTSSDLAPQQGLDRAQEAIPK